MTDLDLHTLIPLDGRLYLAKSGENAFRLYVSAPCIESLWPDGYDKPPQYTFRSRELINVTEHIARLMGWKLVQAGLSQRFYGTTSLGMQIAKRLYPQPDACVHIVEL